MKKILSYLASGKCAGLLSAAALLLLAAGGGWLLTGYISSHLGRVNAGTSAAGPSGPLNILLAGVDVRAGLTKRQQRVLHVGHATGHNSDTLMVVHITADHRHMFVTEQIRVPLPMATAAVRLANLTRGGGLAGASRLAYQDGTEALLRVGPLGDHGPHWLSPAARAEAS